MAKTKEQKAAVVEKLEGALKSGASAVFVHFTGLTVADEMTMRRSLRGESVSYFVAKKTLIRRALDKLGHKHEELPLKGEVAVAWSTDNDITLTARRIHEFGSKFKEKLTILGGIFENRILGQAEMQEIAMIPPLQTLHGMFVNVINSPLQGLAIALNAIAQKKS